MIKQLCSYKSVILFMVEPNINGKLLDLGCDDSVWTVKIARKM